MIKCGEVILCEVHPVHPYNSGVSGQGEVAGGWWLPICSQQRWEWRSRADFPVLHGYEGQNQNPGLSAVCSITCFLLFSLAVSMILPVNLPCQSEVDAGVLQKRPLPPGSGGERWKVVALGPQT